jgi:hypothetical protein
VKDFKFPLRVLDRVGNLNFVEYGKIHRGLLQSIKVGSKPGAGRRRQPILYIMNGRFSKPR